MTPSPPSPRAGIPQAEPIAHSLGRGAPTLARAARSVGESLQIRRGRDGGRRSRKRIGAPNAITSVQERPDHRGSVLDPLGKRRHGPHHPANKVLAVQPRRQIVVGRRAWRKFPHGRTILSGYLRLKQQRALFRPCPCCKLGQQHPPFWVSEAGKIAPASTVRAVTYRNPFGLLRQAAQAFSLKLRTERRLLARQR
jgi:hypothetical protein